jgi:hypothetical protein
MLMLIAYKKLKGFSYFRWFIFGSVGTPNKTFCFSSTNIGE